MRGGRRRSQESAAVQGDLLNTILAIDKCATLDEALESLLHAALNLTKMDGGGVYRVEGDFAVLRYHHGLPEAFIRRVTHRPLTLASIQVLLARREPVEIAEISPVMKDLLGIHGIQHAFCFPLRAHGIPYGFLNIGSTRPESPARADIRTLQILVKHVEALCFRQYSEKILREDRERHRTLWESALDGISLYELPDSSGKGRFIDVNDVVCRMMGYTREEFLRLSPFDIVEEEEREKIPGLIGEIRQSGKISFEITGVAKDGRRIPVEISGSVIRLGDHDVVLTIVRDVTERRKAAEALRESQERFSAFMDNSPAVAWMRDERGRYVYLSRTYSRRTGRSLEDCRGKTVFDLWPREIAEGFRKIDREVLRAGRPIELMEETPAPDGGRSYWWNIKFPFQDASGRRFVGGIGVDITQRRHLEEELQQMNDRLEEQVQARTEELSRTIDQLQAAMGELRHRADQLQRLTLELVQTEDRERARLAEFLHDDLQQTLAAAKFHLAMLTPSEGDEAARETLEQALRLLKDAIDKSRNLSHELGPPVLYRGKLDAVFEWLADQMERKHGLVVHVNIRGSADSSSEPVRSFLCRAAQEILFNTTKHAGVREAKLRLQRVRNELWLAISDKGRGFDPKAPEETTGFGLSTIRGRVELLGGRMAVKSAPGKGSIIFIAIPDAGA